MHFSVDFSVCFSCGPSVVLGPSRQTLRKDEKSCIVSLNEHQGTLPCLYPSKVQQQRGKVLVPREGDGLNFPQPNGLRITALDTALES